MNTQAEVPATPELASAIALNIETVEMPGAERPNFGYLDEAAQEAYKEAHPGYFNSVRKGERSVVMATTANEGHDWADSLATDVASEAVQESLASHGFDGASEADAENLMRRAIGNANAELRLVKGQKSREAIKNGVADTWQPAEASVSAIRFFRDDQGKQKAVISNAGANRVLKSTRDGTEVVLDAQGNQPPFSGPRNTVRGRTDGVVGEVKVVGVNPGERFIIVDNKMGEQDGPDATAADIGAVAGRNITDNPAGAAADIADIPEVGDRDAGYASRIGDSTTVVVDVEAQRGDWNRAEKLLRAPTRAFVGMQIRANDRKVRSREAYMENPTRLRRILAGADTVFDLGTIASVGLLGYKIVTAAMGHAHGGGSSMVPDLLHSRGASAPTPSASHNTNPFDNLTQPSSSASNTPDNAPSSTPDLTPSSPAVAPTSTSELPDPGIAPNPSVAPTIDLNHLDPNHLPAGVHLTDEQVKWLESSHSEGAIGAFHVETGTDGLGDHGTVWHNAMESLHHAGYDPSKMSTDEKKAWVQHVLDLNHKTWDQAAQEGDTFKPVMPTNQDIFSTVSHITAHHEGGPLMPAANSDMAHHLNDIRGTVEAQQIGGKPGGTGATSTAGGTPTGNPATTPTTAAPTSQATTHPAAAPSADAAASHSVPHSVEAANDWILDNKVPLLAGTAAVVAAGVGVGAALVIRNRGNVTVNGFDPGIIGGGLPDFLRGQAEPESRLSGPDDKDEEEDEVKPVRIRTGEPIVRKATPGNRYGGIPPAPKPIGKQI